MKRIGGALIAFALVAAAVVVSNRERSGGELQIETAARNPWNHLKLNNDPAEFRFAIVSDRTGGHREKIFSVAVEQINIMQPEFVVSVGDLIEGYSEETPQIAGEWKEFQSYINRLQMPFFYVPGNHDYTTAVMEQWWKDNLGRSYYHFVYRNVLFLMLNSSDQEGKKTGQMSPAQVSYFKKVLDENRGVRWTMVFLHHPLWTHKEAETNGWIDFEKLIVDRPYTVLCGHVHRFQRYIRHGKVYYQLATTGGGSKVRGTRYGEFDHITWVTMKKDGPVLGHVMLDGILAENLKKPDSNEAGSIIKDRKETFSVRGRIMFEGKPVAGAQITFHSEVRGVRGRPDALSDADGSFILTTYVANDGAPAGDYKVTVLKRERDADGKLGPNQLPAKYAKEETSGLSVHVREGMNQFDIELRK